MYITVLLGHSQIDTKIDFWKKEFSLIMHHVLVAPQT